MKYPALVFVVALAMALTQFVDVKMASAFDTFTVDSTANGDDSDPSNPTCDNGTGVCTLAAAIEQASVDPDQDVINFNIPPSDPGCVPEPGFCFIFPLPALPTVSNPAIIDGTTQPGYLDKPVIVIDAGVNDTGATPTLRITGGSSTVRGLTLMRSCCTPGLSHGIELSVNGGNSIEANFIGIDWTGQITDPPTIPGTDDSWGNRGSGVYVNNSSNNTIGGVTPDKRNIISGNFYEGVWIKGGSNNTVAGNLIGVDFDGNEDDGNLRNGVLIEDSSGNTVGGSTGTSPGAACTGACNVISGNNDNGVQLKGGTATNNTVSGNFIGTEGDGTGRRKNDDSGVFINGAPGNTIGGTTAAARNVISGNVISDVQIQLAASTGNVVRGNFIGTELTGAAAIDAVFQTAFKGVVISGAPNNIIGGSANTTPTLGCAGACNVISAHLGDGIDINQAGATGNTIQGNYIGVNAAGTVALANGVLTNCDGSGILVNGSPGNTIGGNDATERNLISGNAEAGIELRTATADNTVVHGNYIGTDKTGASAIGNCKYGVYINASENQQIGGGNAGEGNLISGNAPSYSGAVGGIFISAPAAKTNTIRGNRIGTDATGQSAIGNGGSGIYISSAPNNTIGGTSTGDRNVISGNDTRGVAIVTAGGNKLLGNYIGLSADGQQAIPNSGNGVLLSEAPANTIGGTGEGTGNVISGNLAVGIDIVGTLATGNTVQGNFIGTGHLGNSDVGNVSHGVRISDASGNFVGGTLPAARNVISGNNEDGVFIEGVNATNNQVRGNFIGVALDGTTPLGNADNGVHVAGSASLNIVGGPLSGAGNIIASNSEDGIFVDQTAGTGNTASRNEIRDNGQLGIDLGTASDVAPGVTQNDPGDADVAGGNELQNFPVVSLAESDNDATPGTHITGALNSKASGAYKIDLYASPTCDPSNYGEGEDHLGTVNVTTDGSGDASFDVIFAFHTPLGSAVTATATDSIGNTSEFSLCEGVVAGTVTPPPGVTPTPGPTPPPGTLVQGDVTCLGGVSAVDALGLLRWVAGLSVSQGDGCPAINANLPPIWGDVNCQNGVNAVDALAVLRWVAGLTVTQTEPCTDIGQPFQ
ncbi:MAG TPA: hypothetical protein VFP63_01450 [Dehalococcoidia bacterium]|nr:hypothetical protein [Dehalococcoidia bacterium]